MRKFLLTILVPLFLLSASASADDVKTKLLNDVSGKISETIASWVPGDGITEFDLEIKEQQEPRFTILAVRDLVKQENSNFFTQLSFHNRSVSDDERYIANLGLGKRYLTSDKSIMFGANAFFDYDLFKHHARYSLGAEARAKMLEFSANKYVGASSIQTIDGTDEEAMDGTEYNLATQIPYMPWAKFNYQYYKHFGIKSVDSTKGDICSLEFALSPTLQLDVLRDISNLEDGQANGALLSFIYPPRENKPTLLDGLTSEDMFVKENMEEHLSAKVRRNNSLAVEVQGTVIITSK